jgi:hypothetical protein
LKNHQKLQQPNKETPKKLATKHQNPSKNKLNSTKPSQKTSNPSQKHQKPRKKNRKIGQPKNPRQAPASTMLETHQRKGRQCAAKNGCKVLKTCNFGRIISIFL